MNDLQQQCVDFMVTLYDRDSIPLFFAESKLHKDFQWQLMMESTWSLWDQICGLTDKTWEKSFADWLKDQKN